MNIDSLLSKLKFDSNGLVPAIVQDATTQRVLTLAYMNREAVQLSIEKGETYFWSRSRQKIWHKGETSGNFQRIRRVQVDCDGDTLLLWVEPLGPACHTGNDTCFFNDFLLDEGRANESVSSRRNFSRTLDNLIQVIKSRKAEMPEGSYTTYLFSKGLDKILKKIGEESAETIIAAKNKAKSELILESADLIYHLLVLFVNESLEIDELLLELEKRSLKQKTRGTNQ